MKKDKSTVLLALTAAAMVLPGIAKKVDASPIDQNMSVDYKITSYEEDPIPANLKLSGSADRYSILANQLKFKAPILVDSEVSFTAVNETMSGASPWYVKRRASDGKIMQVMSGATIDESRNEVGAAFRSYNKSTNSETTISTGYSKENDYRSLSFGFNGAFYVNQNLTTLEYGVNTSKDYIDATDAAIYNRPTNEMKNRLGMLVGASHILAKNTLISGTLSYALLDGYLSDPYKLASVAGNLVKDNRPYWNEQLALTLSLRQFFDEANGALHVDYRFYTSTWNLDSNTLDLAWYQNLGHGWQLIPSVRAYKQTKAEFYQPVYDTTRTDGYYSSDYRLSAFSANSAELKVLKEFKNFTMNISYEKYDSSGSNPGLVSYEFLSFGTSVKF